MVKRVTDVPPQIDALTALGTLTKRTTSSRSSRCSTTSAGPVVGSGCSSRSAPSTTATPRERVLVAEVTAPLRAQVFQALAATADAWLETHEALSGIVVHSRGFPGWENVAGMLGHFRFVRDHHRTIRRVALAADGAVAELAPRLAEHFIRAEITRFGYDELDEAVVCSRTSARPKTRPSSSC
jgi:hypothetical protein